MTLDHRELTEAEAAEHLADVSKADLLELSRTEADGAEVSAALWIFPCGCIRSDGMMRCEPEGEPVQLTLADRTDARDKLLSDAIAAAKSIALSRALRAGIAKFDEAAHAARIRGLNS